MEIPMSEILQILIVGLMPFWPMIGLGILGLVAVGALIAAKAAQP